MSGDTLGQLGTALVILANTGLAWRISRKQTAIGKTVEHTKNLVNAQHADAVNREDQLTAEIEAKGNIVPVRPPLTEVT